MHVAALVRAFCVVPHKEGVEVGLHLFYALVSPLTALDAEVFIQKGPVQPLDIAVALGPPHLGGAVFDLLQLQEQLVGMPVRMAAELAGCSHTRQARQPCLRMAKTTYRKDLRPKGPRLQMF